MVIKPITSAILKPQPRRKQSQNYDLPTEWLPRLPLIEKTTSTTDKLRLNTAPTPIKYPPEITSATKPIVYYPFQKRRRPKPPRLRQNEWSKYLDFVRRTLRNV